MKLQVAEHLAFPLQAVTETFGILAVRGAGKSNTAAVMAEEMFRCKLPFVVVDPVRAWFGLRSSADGTGPGLPIPIFGGRRGDVPLERGAGALMADLVVDQRLSCVLDLSDFDSEGGKKQFLLDFARRLYQRNEQPLHLFLEEADDYIPQRPMRDEAQLLRAWENIVRRGRARGLGITLITQRSAAINKNVLTQVQTLIAMRTTGPQDIAAIREWVKYHQQSEEILASLATLKDGEAWVWSPQLLGKTVRVRFRQRDTFDSGATPRMGEGTKAPATLADIDLEAVKRRMAATIERAKAEDPRELRREIAGLKAELAKAKAAPAPAAKEQRIEVPVLTGIQVKQLEAAIGRLEKAEESGAVAAGAVVRALQEISAAVRATRMPPATLPRPLPGPAPARRASLPTRRRAGSAPATPGPGLTGPGRKILTALAQHGARTTAALAILTGYAASGGAFRNPLSALRSSGYVEGWGTVEATALGLETLGAWDPLPTGRALLEWWLTRLPGPEAKLLRATAGAYPKAIEVVDLAMATGYEVTGGAFRNPLSRLRTLGLVAGRGELLAAEELFGG